MERRAFIRVLGLATLAGVLPMAACSRRGTLEPRYDLGTFGNARLLHLTDTHGQLLPIHHREPAAWPTGAEVSAPLGLTGDALLEHYALPAGSPEAHALTHLDYLRAAREYGKVGGYAQLATLVRRLRAEAGEARTLLLDGGDSWQGSATALWTEGRDMVGAGNLLGVDAMTGHWEFTWPAPTLLGNVEAFEGAFLAQNVTETRIAPPLSTESRVFEPYVMRELGGRQVAVIGQAFPHTHDLNPPRFTPDWRFGIRLDELQQLTAALRERERADCVVLLSHNGLPLDLHLASQVRGIDVILGGHSHRALPQPLLIDNPGGTTLVTAGGCNGKFVGVLDLDIGEGRLRDYRYRLLPVFSDYLEPDADMTAYIEEVRRPFAERLAEPLAETASLLYSSGALSTPWAELIGEAQRQAADAEMGLTPGFRWGTTVLPGETITMETLLAQTATTYPETYLNSISGGFIQLMLEDQCDKMLSSNIERNEDSDALRLSGVTYTCDPRAAFPSRISELRFARGAALDESREYKIAGWGTRRSVSLGRPVWDVVAAYLREIKTVELEDWQPPRLVSR